ncbi:virulence RhuM family protein [Desulfovibrio litoralis]|uniref:Uncharacterized conserved protein n=1 Tax=Desulfovibrio litoralis DSM 11393 TaxID=1121455 RepID=A0A1M7S0B0_9BACT|nr:virulence RhuM family protein [Desulfovibrio litoralis]SHN52019.1 Uncharacterized conserved protein [Desulfovibrio litoralis DSM 11393]
MSIELDFLIYNAPNEDVKVNVIVKDETVWVTQKAMAELFGIDRSVVTKHLKNIFITEELNKETVCAFFAHTATDGKTYNTQYYNLDAIISVGYRVNSAKATSFRIWATKILKEYIQKGFVMDDERLKQGSEVFGKDYFKELLERVRSIRASERRIWQQITDIFAECSIDYSNNSDFTKNFYAMVQNKFHYAITGKTAAEIIYSKADKTQNNMGLTTWKNSPDGRILKSDAKTAKNYLSEKEIKQLERLVSGYFDYIEDLIERENTFTMEEFSASINEFLEFRRYDILKDKGKISMEKAQIKAISEYDAFNKTQKIVSDFDRSLKKLTAKHLGSKKVGKKDE